jgi:diketogulonate reductase-like aldo/keto reductase
MKRLQGICKQLVSSDLKVSSQPLKQTFATIPLVGLGTWQAGKGDDAVQKIVELAIDLGYRHIDCAAAYGNEQQVGAAIAKKIADGVVKREDLYVVSKLWNTQHEPKDVVPACRQTLKDLGLKYIDLYLIHWPVAFASGKGKFPTTESGRVDYGYTPIEQTWKAMEALVQQGLTKAIGLSNFNSKQIDRIIRCGTIRPACLQIESTPYLTQEKLIDFCNKRDIQVVAYSPLGSNDRPWGKKDDQILLQEPKVLDLAKKYKKSPAQILLRFQVQRGVAVIPKTIQSQRLIENLQVTNFNLSDEDMNALKSLNRNFRYCYPRFVNKFGEEVDELDPSHPEYPFGEEF